MRSIVFFLLCCSLALSKYSFTDKCYRFEKTMGKYFTVDYQYYFNRKDAPLSNDFIVYENTQDEDNVLATSYYYHYVFSDCEPSKLGYDCVSTCDSVWFKIWNATAAGKLTAICDKAFIGRYANVMEHDCRNGTYDRFSIVKKDINTKSNVTVFMKGKEPTMQADFIRVNKCVWEYDVMGLWSMVTMIIVCSVAAVALLILIGLIIFTQKHRENKRKRLEGSLVNHVDAEV